MKRIPITVVENGRAYVLSPEALTYLCPDCRYSQTNKATIIGHMRLVHNYNEGDAITIVNAQRRTL